MTININLNLKIELELELDRIYGPLTYHKEDGTFTRCFYIGATDKSSGYYSRAFVRFTDNTVQVSQYQDSPIYERYLVESLVIQQILEDLLEDAGATIEADLGSLWTDGYINVTPEESDLIKSLFTKEVQRFLIEILENNQPPNELKNTKKEKENR